MQVGFVLAIHFRDRYRSVSSCQLSGTDRAGQARAGHAPTTRTTLCYSCLIPQPLAPHPLTIRLTSALPRPSCILQCFCQILHMPSGDVWHQLQNYHQLYLLGESREHGNKTGCSGRDGDVSPSQAFCWKKAAKHRGFFFASLTDTAASFPALCLHEPR